MSEKWTKHLPLFDVLILCDITFSYIDQNTFGANWLYFKIISCLLAKERQSRYLRHKFSWTGFPQLLSSGTCNREWSSVGKSKFDDEGQVRDKSGGGDLKVRKEKTNKRRAVMPGAKMRSRTRTNPVKGMLVPSIFKIIFMKLLFSSADIFSDTSMGTCNILFQIQLSLTWSQIIYHIYSIQKWEIFT